MTGGQMKEESAKEVVIKKPEAVKAVVPEPIKEPVKKEIIAVKTEIKPVKKVKKSKPTVKKEPVNLNGRVPVFVLPTVEEETEKVRLMSQPESAKKTIRRSGLEIQKAEELQEKKKIAQEKEWEIPAFLRKVKFKS